MPRIFPNEGSASVVPQSYRAQLADKRHKDLLQLITELDLLPSTFSVPMHVLSLHRRGDAAMDEFAAAISADPGLAAKVIGLANSAVFAPASQVTRLSQAVAMIGIKNLLPLIFGFSLGGIFNKMAMPPVERSGLWKASLLKAVTAREVATELAPQFAEEAFLYALFQDVALPVIYASDRSAWPETSAVLQLDSAQDRRQRELQIYGTDHAALGQMVARQIGLPVPFQLAIGAHHGGPTALEALGDSGLARALDVASSLPHRVPQLLPQVVQLLGMRLRTAMGGSDAKTLAALLKRIGERFAATLSTVGDKHESGAGFKEFIEALGAEIARAMVSAVGEANSKISVLQARETELQEKISTLQEHAAQSDFDGLTRTLNRRAFFARVTRVLALAREYQRPCAVGFLDMDDFKGMNDTYGHAAGDAALVALVARLDEAIKGRGICGRLGGDEFAFLVIGADADALGADVERVRAALASLSIPAGGAQVQVPTSVGVTMVGIPDPKDTADAVLKRADEAMYKVKQARKFRGAVRAATAATAATAAAAAGGTK
jgi:diguanylate cyclase (GGDEF)-like protein